jgi:membrane-associated phospholipid phosphatase
MWESASVNDNRRSSSFLLAGLLLVVAGLACWQLGWDLPLHRWFRLAGASWTPRIVGLSALGGLLVMGPIGLLAMAFLFVRRRAADAWWLLATVASGRLAVEGLKLLVMRPRPPVVDQLELVKSWSFPSSHSAGTMMTCLALAILVGGRPRAIFAALAVALIIGWSRVALAVHWPSDVLAGWGIGMLWLGLALRIHIPGPIIVRSEAP